MKLHTTKTIQTWTRRTLIALVVCATIPLASLPTDAKQPGNIDAGEQGVQALSEFIAHHPEQLAIVLVSTPGCGFCDRLRKEQLAPLTRDPAFSHVNVFEVLMRDKTHFEPAIPRLESYDGKVFSNIKTPDELSRGFSLRVAPTVLFLGRGRELSERLVGYGNPDFYFAYLSERIDSAHDQLTARAK